MQPDQFIVEGSITAYFADPKILESMREQYDMRCPEPKFDVYERDGFFFVRGLTGGYGIGGYKSRVLAEGYAKNLQYMFRIGWVQREEAFREALDLNGGQ